MPSKKKNKRKGCWGCRICDVANKKYGKCVSGICACHLIIKNKYNQSEHKVTQKVHSDGVSQLVERIR